MNELKSVIKIEMEISKRKYNQPQEGINDAFKNV